MTTVYDHRLAMPVHIHFMKAYGIIPDHCMIYNNYFLLHCSGGVFLISIPVYGSYLHSAVIELQAGESLKRAEPTDESHCYKNEG